MLPVPIAPASKPVCFNKSQAISKQPVSMLLQLIAAALAGLLAVSLVYVLAIAVRNYHAFGFFKRHHSKLPVLEAPSLFAGHATKIYLHPRNWRVISELHGRLGPTYGWFAVHKPMVYTMDLDLLKTVLVDEPDEHVNRVTMNLPFKEFEQPNSISFAEGHQWRRLRKAMAPAFSAHKIKQPNVQQELMDIIDRFVDSIDQRLELAARDHGRQYIVQDAEDIFHRFALAIVFKSFYKQDNIIDMDGERDEHVHMMAKSVKTAVNPLLKLSIMLPVLKHLLNWLLVNFHYQGKLRIKIMDFIRSQTENNLEARKQMAELQSGPERQKELDKDNFVLRDGTRFKRNMVDYLTEQYHDGRLSHSEYFNSSFFLFFAANKTSADAVSRFVCLMARHQDEQERIRRSVVEFGPQSEYLGWAFHETMRLFAPAPLGSVRIITRDIQTKAGLVPAGTCVCSSVHAIHRSKEFWGEDADEFKPERWANAKQFHPCQFMAFGVGKRNCFGKEFALQSTKLVIAELVVRFKFELTEDGLDDYAFNAPGMIFTVAEKPMKIKISRLLRDTKSQ